MNVYTACAKFLLLLPGIAVAEEQVTPMLQATPMASAGKVVLFLVLILGLIIGLAWLVNKTRVGQWTGGVQHLKTLAVLPLGQREKVAIIQAGEQQLVIGITPHGINTLATLDQPIDVADSKPADFADILKKAVRK